MSSDKRFHILPDGQKLNGSAEMFSFMPLRRFMGLLKTTLDHLNGSDSRAIESLPTYWRDTINMARQQIRTELSASLQQRFVQRFFTQFTPLINSDVCVDHVQAERLVTQVVEAVKSAIGTFRSSTREEALFAQTARSLIRMMNDIRNECDNCLTDGCPWRNPHAPLFLVKRRLLPERKTPAAAASKEDEFAKAMKAD